MPVSLSALPFESAHVPSTMTDRDYASKGGERRNYDKRVYDLLAASISVLGSTARRRKMQIHLRSDGGELCACAQDWNEGSV
jgi:hypothetical protein